jgi:phosphatidylserine/phosphatidylglycerophosphate/cardiolipin synthase-like enzyme
MINQAQEIIQLQVYIFDYDETGRSVTDALIAASKRHVQVYPLSQTDTHPRNSPIHLSGKWSGIHFRFLSLCSKAGVPILEEDFTIR